MKILLLAWALLFFCVPPARAHPGHGPICWNTAGDTSTRTSTAPFPPLAPMVYDFTGCGDGLDCTGGTVTRTGTSHTIIFPTVSWVHTHTVTDLGTGVEREPPTLGACADAHYVLVPIGVGLSIVGLFLGCALCVELYRMRRGSREREGRR